MNRIEHEKSSLGSRRDDAAIREVLEAAADPAPPSVAPPFLASRVRARAAAEPGPLATAPVLVAAWRLLPVFAVVATLLVCMAGYESARFEREREAAVARALAGSGGGDVLLGTLLAGGGAAGDRGGAR